MKLWRMIQAGEIRAFKETFYFRPPGAPHAYQRRRLFVSSAELNRYMSRKEDEYEIERHRQARREGRPSDRRRRAAPAR